MAIQQYVGVIIVLVAHQLCFGQQETGILRVSWAG